MANDVEITDADGSVYMGEVDQPAPSRAANYLKGHKDAIKGMNPVQSVTKGYTAARDFLKGDSKAAQVIRNNSDPLGLGEKAAGKAAEATAPGAPAAGGDPNNPYDKTFGTFDTSAPGMAPMQLTPPRLIGAHFDPSRVPLRSSTQEMMFGALDNSRSMGAQENLANVQANAAEASANILEQEAERARFERAQRMEREEQRQAQVRDMLSTAKKLNEESSKLAVDPSRFHKSTSGILMSIGAVLRPGNDGMQQLESAWHQDLALQREDIARARQKGLDVENSLAKYQDAFKDERAAELAWEADARDIARMKLMALAERSQSPQILAHAKVINAQMLEMRDAKRADLTARLDQMSYVPAQMVGGGMGAQQKPLENVVNLPNGVSLQMPSKELQQKGVEKIEYTEVIRANNNRALQLREEIRKNPTSAPQKLQELKMLQDQTVSMLSLARGQGVVKEAEFQRAAESAASYTSLTPGADTTIRASSENAVRDLGFFMRASGAEQVQRGYTQVPGKGVQPTGAYVGHNVKPQTVQDPKSFELQQPMIKSDIFAKNVISGPSSGPMDKLNSDMSMDVMGSLRHHSNVATQFNSDPSGGMMGGGIPIISDERAKQAAYAQGIKAGRDQYEGEIISASAYVGKNQYDAMQGKPKEPRLTDAERASMNLGGTPLAQAARSQAGSVYEYKPGLGPPTQAPGEVNVGPIAQNMAADPVASTVVKQGPDGMLNLDPQKTLTLNAAINADQQKQIDKIAMALAHFRGGRHR